MLQTAEYLLTASLAFVVIALVTNLVLFSASRRAPRRHAVKQLATVGAPAAGASGDTVVGDGLPDDAIADEVTADLIADDVVAEGATSTTTADLEADLLAMDDEVDTHAPTPSKPKEKAAPLNVGAFGTGFTIVAWVILTAYLGIRIALTGHGPFANQHEFAVSFVWGILAAYLVAYWRFKIRMISLVVLPVSACLLLYAISLGSEVAPLVPALQNNLLLTLHVGFAVLSYGAACVSFGAAVLYLLYPHLHLKTSRDRLDEIGYKGAVVAFPLMTIMILLGSLWANTAWGSYWSWDPKETAALVTWLLYLAFLHARVSRGWRGTKSAWLLVIGFAAVMFAYFGNMFFGGLHSYA
ncbi:MAG: cytochrome c biogenesis protein CcsA [Propionibacteriaceae bacterium]|nr:cytochrome c biogenesis protein CcsA [Propionibacteriaceae bacterium]